MYEGENDDRCKVDLTKVTAINGDNIYGIVVCDQSAGASRICGLNMQWGKSSNSPYIGIMSEWLNTSVPPPALGTKDGLVIHTHETQKKTKYYHGDLFQVKSSVQGYVGLDAFANNLITRCVANACLLYHRKLLHHIEMPVAYSICNKYGMASYRVNKGTLWDLRTSFTHSAREVINTITNTLDCLQTHSQFFHGQLTLSSVIVDGNDRIRLSNFDQATIRHDKVGLFNHLATLQSTNITIDRGTEPTPKWWKLGKGFDVETSLILAHSNLPYYRTLDWYVFVVSLMLVREWHNSIMELGIWEKMWLKNELSQVTADTQRFIQTHNTCPTIQDVYTILKRYCIRSTFPSI